MEWKTFNFKGKREDRKGEVLSKHIYRYGFCSGRGFIPSKKSTRCTVCLGTGTIKIQPPAVICAYCSGTGKSHINTDLACIVCGGRGVIGIHTKLVEICPNCKGKGREKGGNLPCLVCRGKGVVIKRD